MQPVNIPLIHVLSPFKSSPSTSYSLSLHFSHRLTFHPCMLAYCQYVKGEADSFLHLFISIILLRTAVQTMTGNERFKYQASDSFSGSLIHILFVRNFAAIGSSSFKGARGVLCRFSLFVVSYGGEWQLPGIFSRVKPNVPSQRYWIFKPRKYIQLHCACELKSRFPKNQL